MLHLTSLSLNLFNDDDFLLNESLRSDSSKRLIQDPWSIDSIKKSREIEKLYEDCLEIMYNLLINRIEIDITKKGFRILFGNWLYSILISIYKIVGLSTFEKKFVLLLVIKQILFLNFLLA